MKKLVFSSLILMTIMSFSLLRNTDKCTNQILLVLKNPMDNNDKFSKFNVIEVDNVLVGINTDDYFVEGGIYRIEGSSNDKFYHKHRLIK